MTDAAEKSRDIHVRLAKSDKEIEDSQRLRYGVFYEEYGAIPSAEMKKARIDKDMYDDYADHLVVVDESRETGESQIVGSYRLLRQDAAEECGQFYTSDEFDISPLTSSSGTLLELGRSCVLPGYRTRPVLQLLWQGIADYITDNNIDVMFGCASLHTTDVSSIAEQLAYLHHFHPSPEDMRPRALNGRYVDMNLMAADSFNPRRAFAALPPIIKGYLRLGGTIGDGAVIDEQFNTTDVCVIVQTHQVTQRYRSHYERKIQKTMKSEGFESDPLQVTGGGA